MARSKSRNKDLNDLIVEMERQGWTVETKKGGHIQFIPADNTQPMVFTSSTPSDWRTNRNLRSQLRKSGADL